MFTCPKRQASESFRVSIHDSASVFRLKLEGRFTAAETREVELCWITARSTIRNKTFVVDLSGATWVDPAARDLLVRLRDCGAQFAAGSGEAGRLAAELNGFLQQETLRMPDQRRALRIWSDFAELLACLFARRKFRVG